MLRNLRGVFLYYLFIYNHIRNKSLGSANLKLLFRIGRVFGNRGTFFGLRKLRLLSKFMTSETGQQIFTMHILSNISRRKGKPTMKFGHLTKYNVRNIFLEKSCKKCDRETSSRPLFVF